MPSRTPLSHEAVLASIIVAMAVLFSLTGTNFATRANVVELVRLSGEVGLLSLALTPIIVTGGIDLSVGSLMGLVAITIGLLWRDGHLPIWAAAVAGLGVGLLGGALNAVLIARFALPPLIVTLATLSLYRGLAEGITRGADFVSGFPHAFVVLGQTTAGGVPPAAVALAAAAIGYGALLHRTIVGRACYAIGWSPEGARFAGIPVARRLALLYCLSGVASACAAVLYVARIDQAKADAGTGYELLAIAAVVLGGTSIMGGRGSIAGTLLGVAGIAVLQNGLRLSDLPAELAGILTGSLLLVTIALSAWAGLRRVSSREAPPLAGGASGAAVAAAPSTLPAPALDGWLTMKNSQLAVLCAAVIAAGVIVAGSNWWLARSFQRAQTFASAAPSHTGSGSGPAGSPAPRRVTIGMMPKAKGDPYFISCRRGAEQAAAELHATLLWDGPTDLDPARQSEVVESWITRGVDVIAVSVENRASVSTALRKARTRGIKVITWDADAEPDARDFFVNQATPQGIGETLTDRAAALLGGKGSFAIITASLSAANQNEWIKYIRARLAERYPDLRLVAIQPSEGDRDRAFAETQTILKVHPEVQLIMGIAAPAVPGAAEAVRQSGRKDVKVIGLSLPNMCKPYVHEGVIDSIVLWNTIDLGYLTVYAAQALATGALAPGSSSLQAGRLGTITVSGDQVLLGKPFLFTKDNIDRFDF